MVSSYERGHRTIWLFDKEMWVYEDTGKVIDGKRKCKRCKKPPTKEGYDACLGRLEGVKNACCGHGIERMEYIQWQTR